MTRIEDNARMIADMRRWDHEKCRGEIRINKSGRETIAQEARELFHHIDHLTAELAAKDAEIERLRAACREVTERYNVIEFDVDESNWIEAVVLYDKAMLALKLALAATAGGEGGA